MEPWLETFARASFKRSADTAHDLKTPLNVAVLNLELLRMRLAKLEVEEDAKLATYARAVEIELRRMGKIFDAFFILSTPPKDGEAPSKVDLAELSAEAAEAAQLKIETRGSAVMEAHPARIRHALELLFAGARSLFAPGDVEVSVARQPGSFALTVTGTTALGEAELAKLFKFYYTDADGNPDLSLAVARLIAETYGGELNTEGDRDKVTLRLSFPLGD